VTPIPGDFLRPARAHITAAARDGGELPIPAQRGVIAERSGRRLAEGEICGGHF
jgi:hypothetical protein